MTEKLQNQYVPDYVTPPGETIEEILVSIGMSKAELSDRIGKTPKHVGDIIKHGAPITPQTAMDLEKVLGTPASFWNNRERRYRESLARNEEKERLKKEVGWLRRFPIADMIKAGCINRQESKVEKFDETFEAQTVHLCSRAGVAVVLVPAFPGAPVYGATRWLTSEKAMIQLSLRGRFEDHFWFTFFHEAGHILLHGKKDIFIEWNQGEDEKELEADQFARNLLIPLGAWQKFLSSGNCRSSEAVETFAAQMDISPAIVVGRLQHEGHLPHSHLNGLRRRLSG
jgi:addiction module HigA family antidote